MSPSADDPAVDDDPAVEDEVDEPRAGDVWRTLIEGRYQDKPRPAVVIEVEDERIEVVYGSGKAQPEGRHLRIAAASPKGAEMGLTKDTYFWVRIPAMSNASSAPDGKAPRIASCDFGSAGRWRSTCGPGRRWRSSTRRCGSAVEST